MKYVLEQILKVDENEPYKILLSETIKCLNFKEYHGYFCCFVGCPYKANRHRMYVKHLKEVHINQDRYLCKFKHICKRNFSSISHLMEHIAEAHAAAAVSARIISLANATDVPCKCDLSSCDGPHFSNLKKFLEHFNNFHIKEARQCVFEECFKWFS